MEKNQEVTAVLGVDGPGGTCGTRRWRGVDRDGRAIVHDEVRRLTAQDLSWRAIARAPGISRAAVVRAQWAGGAS